MTKCYPVKSIKMKELHGDCFCKVVGIYLDVHITQEQFMDISPKKDVVACKYDGRIYRVTRIFKNKVNL